MTIQLMYKQKQRQKRSLKMRIPSFSAYMLYSPFRDHYLNPNFVRKLF